ncbi:MAG TPA: hypothetical protein VK811_06445 [Candidatus Acidoferrum sp.]|jgi:hypothetical protein|nr:hypothetical protein [Candidatus Acidoferrum sp.]
MIVFQSPAIAKTQDHLPKILPLPAGEGRGEGELSRLESCVGSGGELNHRGRHSALIKVGRVSPLTAVVHVTVSNPWLLRASLKPCLLSTSHHARFAPFREQSTQINPLSSNTNQIPTDTGQKMNALLPSLSQPHGNPLNLNLGEFKLNLGNFR